MSDAVAAELADLGIPVDQARVFVQLTRSGAASATELARALRFSRPRTYRALEDLVSGGHVTASVGRPRIFSAVPAAMLLKALQFRAYAHAEKLEAARRDLVPRIEALSGGSKASHEPVFALLRGRQSFVSQARQVVGEARDCLDVVVDEEGGRDLLQALLPPGGAGDGASAAKVRLLLPSSSGTLRRLPANLKRAHVAVRHWRGETLSTCVLADRREAVIVVTGQRASGAATDGWLAMRTTAAHFVATNQAIFDRVWADSTADHS